MRECLNRRWPLSTSLYVSVSNRITRAVFFSLMRSVKDVGPSLGPKDRFLRRMITGFVTFSVAAQQGEGGCDVCYFIFVANICAHGWSMLCVKASSVTTKQS